MMELRREFPKLDMPEGMIRQFATPPQSPEECVFALTTQTVSADLKTKIVPCQDRAGSGQANHTTADRRGTATGVVLERKMGATYEKKHVSGQPDRTQAAAAANRAGWQRSAAYPSEHWEQFHKARRRPMDQGVGQVDGRRQAR